MLIMHLNPILGKPVTDKDIKDAESEARLVIHCLQHILSYLKPIMVV